MVYNDYLKVVTAIRAREMTHNDIVDLLNKYHALQDIVYKAEINKERMA